jgi:hypothetical protein
MMLVFGEGEISNDENDDLHNRAGDAAKNIPDEIGGGEIFFAGSKSGADRISIRDGGKLR